MVRRCPCLIAGMWDDIKICSGYYIHRKYGKVQIFRNKYRTRNTYIYEAIKSSLNAKGYFLRFITDIWKPRDKIYGNVMLLFLPLNKDV
jgi:hypothetical protein